MFECFHCGERSVVWDNDFSFEDFCLEGEGIVHVCHCGNCGANITYEVPISDDDIKAISRKNEPREKRGTWYEIDGCMTMCSECHALGCGTPFCPNCGAKMEV